jgi:hypothetical protein
MLLRISLIVAILAGLAVGGLNFVKVKDKVTALIADRDNEKKIKEQKITELNSTKKTLEKTTVELNTTKTNLAVMTDEKDKAVASATEQTKRAEKLTEDLNKTKQERDGAQSELAAYKATGMDPKQISGANKRIKDLEGSVAASESENKILAGNIKKLKNELNEFKPDAPPVEMPGTLAGKVVSADPKWNFVVINLGENQGILRRGQLLINRNGRLVAKVVVSRVDKDRCIANVMPGWQLGEVLEGDQVIAAYPAS